MSKSFIACVHPSMEHDLRTMMRKEYAWSIGVPVYRGHSTIMHAARKNAKSKFRPTSACGIKMRAWNSFVPTPTMDNACEKCRRIVATAILTED